MVNEPERYCSRQYLKNALGIPADETDHDPKLNECIAESQVVVDNALTPYAETTPIPPIVSILSKSERLLKHTPRVYGTNFIVKIG